MNETEARALFERAVAFRLQELDGLADPKARAHGYSIISSFLNGMGEALDAVGVLPRAVSKSIATRALQPLQDELITAGVLQQVHVDVEARTRITFEPRGSDEGAPTESPEIGTP